MNSQVLRLRLTVSSEAAPAGPPAADDDQLVRSLYDDLLELELPFVAHAAGEGEVASAGGPEPAGSILIELVVDGPALATLIRAVQVWLSRRVDEVRVAVAADGRVIEFTRGSSLTPVQIAAALAPVVSESGYVVSESGYVDEPDGSAYAEAEDESSGPSDVHGVDAQFGWDDGERG